MELKNDKTKMVREHHYFFAQKTLFDYVYKNAFRVLENLRIDKDLKEIVNITGWNNEALKFIKRLWFQTYTDLVPVYPDMEKIEFAGIDFKTYEIDDSKTIILFTLPLPQAISESYSIGIYFNVEDVNQKVQDSLDGLIFPRIEIRYFTLEYHNEKESAFCELHQGQHTIYDLSDNLTNEEFRNKIMDLVK